MGTDFMDFLREADRLLRTGGCLLIAEVRSRIDGSGGDMDPREKKEKNPRDGRDKRERGGGGAREMQGLGRGDGRRDFGTNGGLKDMTPPPSPQLARFVQSVLSVGGSRYQLRWSYNGNPLFVMLEFSKETSARPAHQGAARGGGGADAKPLLKPCVYKKR
jgi:hypothetical protein